MFNDPSVNDNGERLIEACVANVQYVPNTFFSHKWISYLYLNKSYSETED